ncbi:MAG: glycosyltransferase family 39 protein, partial [Chloroflexota bacterium]
MGNVPNSKLQTQSLKLVSPLLLFGLAFAIRLVYALQINFPPLDDPAYYIQAARSLSGPRPLDFELSIIWNFHPLFDNVRHPAMEFWMPLSSFLIGFSTWLFGDHFFTAQLPSLIAGALLPVYTWYFARRFLPAGLSLVAGLLVALNPLLAYQSALPDSSMLYAALVCPALLMLGSLRGKAERWFLGRALAFGWLVGLAYLARTPAVFLALTYFGFWILDFRWINRKSKILELLMVILGMALPVGGWSLRNFLLFGFISSPAGTQTLFLFDYQDLFNYQTPVNFATWLEGGLGKIIGIRLEALGSAWR